MTVWRDAEACRRLLRGLLCGLGLTLPFVAAAQALAYLAAAAALLLLARHRTAFAGIRRAHWVPALLFALLCLGSLAWGTDGARGLPRIHRLLLLLLIPAVPAAFSGRSLLPLAASVCGGAAASALEDVVRIPWVVFHEGRRLLDAGSMTTPQFYLAALLLLLAVPAREWAAGLARPVFARILGWPALLLCAYGLLIHNKRGCWLAFMLSVLLLSVLRRNSRLLGVIALGAAVVAAIPATRNRMAELAQVMNPNRGDRAVIWEKIAPPMLAGHPWGYGYKSMRNTDLQSYHAQVQPKLNHLHNNALQLTAELGWAGGAVWVLWMLHAWGRSLRATRILPGAPHLAAGVCAALSGLLLNGLVEHNFGDTEIFMLFCLLLGIVACLDRPSAPDGTAG